MDRDKRRVIGYVSDCKPGRRTNVEMYVSKVKRLIRLMKRQHPMRYVVFDVASGKLLIRDKSEYSSPRHIKNEI